MRFSIMLPVMILLLGMNAHVVMAQQAASRPPSSRDGRPFWSPDGQYIAFIRSKTLNQGNPGWSAKSSNNSTEEFWLMKSDGTGTCALLALPDTALGNVGRIGITGVSWSMDGKSLLCGINLQNAGSESTIWRITLDGRKTRCATLSERVEYLSFSHDGKQMAFSNGNSLCVAAIDGSDCRQLLTGRCDSLQWSADNQRVYCTRYDDQYADLWEVPIAGGAPRNITQTPASYEHTPKLSPDGTRLVYIEGIGNRTLYVTPVTIFQPTQILPAARIAYWTLSGDRLLALVDVGQPKERKSEMRQIDLTGRVITKFPDVNNGSIDISPDGSRFAYAGKNGIRIVPLKE